jgi:hypothetical protein
MPGCPKSSIAEVSLACHKFLYVLHLVVVLDEGVTALQSNCCLFSTLCSFGDTMDPSFGC